GYVLPPIGAVAGVLGLGWATLAWRRLRFDQGLAAPGVVELVEGQIGYLGPGAGGFVSLTEMTELRLLALRGRRVWRLKQADGQALLIPVEAAGAERLFDAFASLPGLTSADLLAALDGDAPQGGQVLTLAASSRLVWARDGKGIVAR
ncbi:MAG: hypothetical protein ACRC14_19100, partial [Paracoccaceae bacterium]